MAVEIERKFLLDSDSWRESAGPGLAMRQGYLGSANACTVRARVAGSQAWLTLKGPSDGLSRAEYEYEIPVSDADEILEDLCQGPVVDKTRYLVEHAGHRWEIDVFEGANAGLIVAEIELGSPDEGFERPAWLGCEVSDDPRYFNSALATHPFCRWED